MQRFQSCFFSEECWREEELFFWHKLECEQLEEGNFNDETKINCFNSYGKNWCWVSDSWRLPKSVIKQTLKHGGGSVMFWGCLIAKGVGSYCQVDQRMNAPCYVEILKADLYGTLEKFVFDPTSVIF